MKNRILTAFAIAGLVGVTACQQREEVRIEEPAVVPPAEQPVVTPAPATDPTVTTQPLPEDTLLMDDATTTDPAAPQTPGYNP